MECISDQAYRSREHLAEDIVRVLREELHFLLAGGAAIVQLDEPVLSEVVMTGVKRQRTFMCGALSEKGDPRVELDFASALIAQVVAGLPRERLALHVCRGNWTPDERVALTGDYRPLLGFLGDLAVGTLFLEMATPRAGDIDSSASCRSGSASVSGWSTRSGSPWRARTTCWRAPATPSTSWARTACSSRPTVGLRHSRTTPSPRPAPPKPRSATSPGSPPPCAGVDASRVEIRVGPSI